ncbi:methyltransferase [Arcobacter sp. 15-2]|uniref:methyltransferase n=1 Tax=Arcobacter sp. 15-2 TaxID=3374109 RepID=UPI00399D3322
MQNNINKYLNMLLVQQETELLGIALDLKIFKLLESASYTAHSLAKKLESDDHNTKVLLDGLVFMDLLQLNNDIYTNTAITKQFFVCDSSQYCGDVYLNRKEMLNSARKMTASLVKNGCGKMLDSKHPKRWASAAKGSLKQEQKTLISPVATNIVKNLKEFKNINKILDLGCSSGIIGLDIIKEHPTSKGVLFDYKEVVDVASEHIKAYGLENRVTTLSGDIELDDIGSGYDLIWCSNIFYFFKDKKEVIQKIYDALSPNGVLVSAHIEIDNNNIQDKISYFYFLFLNMQKRNKLEPMEMSNIFEDVGFRSVNSYTNYDMPMTPFQIHIAKK